MSDTDSYTYTYTYTDSYSYSTNSSSNKESESESESEISSHDVHNEKEKEKEKRYRKMKEKEKCFILLIVSCILMIIMMMIIIIIIIIKGQMQVQQDDRDRDEKRYFYRTIFYDMTKGEGEGDRIQGGEIMKNKLVRNFYYFDDNGMGYIYLMNMNDGEEGGDEEEDVEYEYKVEGECICCVNDECNDDDDDGKCNENKVCVNKNCVDCRNDNDCDEKYVCNQYGKCLERDNDYCIYDNDCKKDEYCNINGECIIGCLNDLRCPDNELCIENQCSSDFCHDNFDCNDYDHVCVNSQCIFVDNTISCTSDNECENGYHCNYEYLICVKLRKETTTNKRSNEVFPAAVCTIYGVITMFVMSSSYIIATNIGKDKLNEECSQKCAANYFAVSGTDVKKLTTTETENKIVKRRDTECTGACKRRTRLIEPSAVEYAKMLCPQQVITRVISARQKIDYLEYMDDENGMFSSLSFFKSTLSLYCKNFYHQYWYHYKNRREWRRGSICQADYKSIKCRTLSSSTLVKKTEYKELF